MKQAVLQNITEILTIIENINIGVPDQQTTMESSIFIESLTIILIKIDLNLFDEEFYDLIYNIKKTTHIENISTEEEVVLQLIGNQIKK